MKQIKVFVFNKCREDQEIKYVYGNWYQMDYKSMGQHNTLHVS